MSRGREHGDREWRERGLHAAVLAGDARAWQRWYDESFADLYAYVGWRCAGLRDVADEITQETWLTAVRRIAGFNPAAGSFAGWLRGIAANLLRNHFRQARRRPPTHSLNGQLPEPAPPTDPAERIARALALLPEHYEAVLRAKYLEHQSVAEIAMNCGDSVKAIESLLTRARQAFREAFATLE